VGVVIGVAGGRGSYGGDSIGSYSSCGQDSIGGCSIIGVSVCVLGGVIAIAIAIAIG